MEFEQICHILSGERITDELRELLGQGLFYYCAGSDISPIVALGSKVQMYVYVDSFVYIRKPFKDTMNELYAELSNYGFGLKEKCSLACNGRLSNVKNAELTLWSDVNGDTFVLLYVQDDAINAYKTIYGEDFNYIMPKYVCNYREEIANLDILKQVEKRVEYILGHCHSSKYRAVDEFDYLGAYGSGNEKMTLFRRHYYYLY